MNYLIMRQMVESGAVKTWKIRETDGVLSFGSSRLADIISIDRHSEGIEGAIEFKNGHWWYLDMSQKVVENGQRTKLTSESKIKLAHSQVAFEPRFKEEVLNAALWNYSSQPGDQQFQLFIVKQGDRQVATKLVRMGQTYRGIKAVACNEWQTTELGALKISQRTVSRSSLKDIESLKASDLIEEDSQKGVFATLAITVLIVALGLLGPKSEPVATTSPVPVASKIVVRKDIQKPMPLQQKPSAPKVEQAQKNNKPQREVASEGGSRPSSLAKAIAGGRISQLLGKVSASAAKTAEAVAVTAGVKAGEGPSGRALAAVGKVESSGKDWGSEKGSGGVTISTGGRGGGRSTAGMGGLVAGKTGQGGVGLIEEESEVTGGLDREIIAQYIKSQLGQILYCYERQLSANPELFGKVAVRFTIGPSGKVEHQLINDTTLKNTTVEGCILNRVAAWKFPAPSGGTRVMVTYPFLFKSTN